MLYGPGSDLANGGTDDTDAATAPDAVATDGGASSGDGASGDAAASLVPADGLVVWLRADDGLVMAGDERVSAWNDSTPSVRAGAKRNDALQTTPSAQPRRTGGPRGLPAVTFEGAQLLELPFGFEDFTHGLSLFVAMQLPLPSGASTVGGPVFALGYTGTGCARAAEMSVGSDGFDYRVENTAIGATSSIAASWEVLSAVQSPLASAGADCPTSNVELRRSGLLISSEPIKVPEKGPRAATRVGRSTYYPDQWLRGVVGEIVLYDRTLTAAETAAVSDYLAKKWAR